VDQAVICSNLTAEARVLSHAVACGISDGQTVPADNPAVVFLNLSRFYIILKNLTHFVVTYYECKVYGLHSLFISYTAKSMTKKADTIHRNREKRKKKELRKTKLSSSSKQKEKQDSYSRTFIINMCLPYITSSCDPVIRQFGQCKKHELKLIG
jgi:hypothetical protein